MAKFTDGCNQGCAEMGCGRSFQENTEHGADRSISSTPYGYRTQTWKLQRWCGCCFHDVPLITCLVVLCELHHEELGLT